MSGDARLIVIFEKVLRAAASLVENGMDFLHHTIFRLVLRERRRTIQDS
jgi:hypothetical protein